MVNTDESSTMPAVSLVARPVNLEELRDALIALCGGADPDWEGTPGELLEQVQFWHESSTLFHRVRRHLANPFCLSAEVFDRVRSLEVERAAALSVVRAVYQESKAIHAAYKLLPEALRAEVER